MKLSSLAMFMYELDVKGCGLMIGLLSMCEVVGSKMYIALVDIDLIVSKVYDELKWREVSMCESLLGLI